MDTYRPIDKVYTYDVDGNLSHLNTNVLLEQKIEDRWNLIEVPAKYYDHNVKYETDEYRPLDGDYEKAFMHSRDFHMNKKHRGIEGYQTDILESLEGKEFANSFYRLIFDSFLEARLSSKNTARGHTPDNLKQGDYIIIDKVLSDEGKEFMSCKLQEKYNYGIKSVRGNIFQYLDNNMYYPGANIEVKKMLGIQDVVSSSLRKTFCQDHYIHYLHKFIRKYQDLDPSCPVKMGFSDDGYNNIKEMMRFFIKKQQEDREPYNNFKYRLYYTGQNIDIVQENLSRELVDLLGTDNDVIVEKKTYNLWEDPNIIAKKSLVTDLVDINKTITNLKIML